jgi:hypothetical protein
VEGEARVNIYARWAVAIFGICVSAISFWTPNDNALSLGFLMIGMGFFGYAVTDNFKKDHVDEAAEEVVEG